MSEPYWEPLGGVGQAEGWYSGAGVPASGLGADGDWYLDTTPGATGAAAPAYGTTLPASPADKQEAILVDSITNPTYQWRFRYNAGSSSAFKWECIGGSPLYAEVQAGVQTPSSAYVTLSGGPAGPIPRAGDYVLDYGAFITAHAVGGGVGYMAPDGAGITAADAISAASSSGNSGASIGFSLARSRLFTGLTAGTVTMKYRGDGAADSFFNFRWLKIQPVRVS